MSMALRDWGGVNFHEYALLYGHPVPGYSTPADTVVPAQRVPQLLLSLMADAEDANLKLRTPRS